MIEVIFPVSHDWLAPYLDNALRSIKGQDLTGRRWITVSMHTPPDEDMTEVWKVCQAHRVNVVCSKWTDPAFNIAKAYNVAARRSQADILAFFDADVVFHPHTLRMAVEAANEGYAAVVSVGYVEEGPESPTFRKRDLKWWAEFAEDLWFRKNSGIGNIVVRRSVVDFLRGFDERFYGWGAADTDFFQRVRKRCGAVFLVDRDLPKALHQEHETRNHFPARTKKRDPKAMQMARRNRRLMDETKGILRNKEVWGDVPSFREGLAAGARLKFASAEAQHPLVTYNELSIILLREKLQGIIEVGTACGALSQYLGLLGLHLGIKVHTVDHKDFLNDSTKQALAQLGVKVHRHDVLADPSLVRRLIRGRKVYLLCDNGNKPKEMQLYAPHLKPGSIVSVHDWLTEVHPTDVAEIVKGFKPIRPKKWAKVAMATWQVT